MTNRGDQRYLRNGSAGGLTKNVGWAILIILGHAAVLLSFCLLVGWPLGRLVGASVFHREFTDEPVRAISFGRRDWVPSAILSIAALAAAGLAGLGRLMTSSNLLLRVAMWIAIAAGAGVLIPIVIPWAVIEVRHLLSSAPGPGTTAQHTLTLAGISASTLLGWIWALAKGRVKRRLPYLGGIALALLLLIVVGLMVQSSAFYRDSWLDVGLCIWLSVAGGFLLLFTVPGIQWASFRPIYTGGLRQ